MTKIQLEVIKQLDALKEQHGCDIYLRYFYHTKKVHAIKLMGDTRCIILTPLCNKKTLTNMLSKGILIEAVVDSIKLCKVA